MVADFNDEVVLAEVPDGGAAAGTGRGQDVLHLTVPRHAADVLQRLRRQVQYTEPVRRIQQHSAEFSVCVSV